MNTKIALLTSLAIFSAGCSRTPPIKLVANETASSDWYRTSPIPGTILRLTREAFDGGRCAVDYYATGDMRLVSWGKRQAGHQAPTAQPLREVSVVSGRPTHPSVYEAFIAECGPPPPLNWATITDPA